MAAETVLCVSRATYQLLQMPASQLSLASVKGLKMAGLEPGRKTGLLWRTRPNEEGECVDSACWSGAVDPGKLAEPLQWPQALHQSRPFPRMLVCRWASEKKHRDPNQAK